MASSLPSDSFRFKPPQVEVSLELHLALWLAFGPSGERLPAQLWRALQGNSDRLTTLSTWIATLDLAPRIGFRRGHSWLLSHFGEGAARHLGDASARCLARTLALEELLSIVANCARDLGQEVMVLKGAALVQGEYTAAGSRRCGDLDVLVHKDTAKTLATRLVREGMTPSPVDATEHHLPVLSHSTLGALELHLFLPGLRFPSSSAVASQGLLLRSLLAQTQASQDSYLKVSQKSSSGPEGGFGLSELAGPAAKAGVRQPSAALLAAHLAVHALNQHAFSPKIYPLIRVVGDWIDLSKCHPTKTLLGEVRPWLEGSVSIRELNALATLSEDLAKGILPTHSDSRKLLAHFTLGASSSWYQRRLKARTLLRTIKAGNWSKLRRRLP